MTSGEWPPSAPAEGAEAEKERHGFLSALTKHWLPFFTALCVLATAVLGIYAKQAANERDELEESATGLEGQVTDLSDSNEELQQANEELQQANDDLEAENEQLREDNTSDTTDGDDSTSPPTTSGPQAGSTPEVLRETGGTPVVVPVYDGIDLDSLEPNWGIESSGRDLYVGGSARTVSVSDTLEIVPAPPTPDVCEAQTVRDDELTEAETVVGQQLCVRTGEGRWAYVRIAAIDTEARTMSFDITVWKLPSDP